MELLAETIAPLPKQLATLIKDKSTLMLRLKRELREKETSLHLFEKKIKDKKTGETVEYRPKACRKESPVTYSNLLEGDPRLEEIKTQFKTITEAFNQEGTQLLKQVAQLEVDHRTDNLRGESMEVLHSVVFNFVLFEMERAKNFLPPYHSTIPVKAMAMMIIDEYLRESSNKQAVALHFTDKDDLMNRLQDYLSNHDWGATEAEVVRNTTMVDNAMIIKIKRTLTDLFPLMTYKLWAKDSEDDMLRQANSVLSSWNEEKELELATERTGMQLDEEPTVPESDMRSQISKMLDERQKKQEKELRKKVMADLKKYQRSQGQVTGSATGGSSGDASTKSDKKSSQNSKKKQSQSKNKTKEKQVRFKDPPQDSSQKNTNSDRNQGNQGKNQGAEVKAKVEARQDEAEEVEADLPARIEEEKATSTQLASPPRSPLRAANHTKNQLIQSQTS